MGGSTAASASAFFGPTPASFVTGSSFNDESVRGGTCANLPTGVRHHRDVDDATDADATPATEVVHCYHHTDRATGLRCTRCERPACWECLRPAPVGSHCLECLKEGARTTRT